VPYAKKMAIPPVRQARDKTVRIPKLGIKISKTKRIAQATKRKIANTSHNISAIITFSPAL
jgi:hypothetical protein